MNDDDLANLICAAHDAAGGTACDQCNADLQLAQYATGVSVLAVVHEDDCRYYARRLQRARAHTN
jgi:hypothetical protein